MRRIECLLSIPEFQDSCIVLFLKNPSSSNSQLYCSKTIRKYAPGRLSRIKTALDECSWLCLQRASLVEQAGEDGNATYWQRVAEKFQQMLIINGIKTDTLEIPSSENTNMKEFQGLLSKNDKRGSDDGADSNGVDSNGVDSNGADSNGADSNELTKTNESENNHFEHGGIGDTTVSVEPSNEVTKNVETVEEPRTDEGAAIFQFSTPTPPPRRNLIVSTPSPKLQPLPMRVQLKPKKDEVVGSKESTSNKGVNKVAAKEPKNVPKRSKKRRVEPTVGGQGKTKEVRRN